MVDKPTAGDAGTPPTETAPQRPPSPHRHADPREAVAELTERAQQISKEAGGKVAAAMKDVVSAAAGIAGFAIESARDLVQYMVRRGQMTQDEADRLLRDVESAHAKRPAAERERPTATKVAAERAAAAKAEAAARAAAAAQLAPVRPPAKPNVAGASPTKAPPAAAAKPARAPAAASKSGAARSSKPAAKKPAAKSAPVKAAAKKAAPKSAAKSAKPAKKPASKKR